MMKQLFYKTIFFSVFILVSGTIISQNKLSKNIKKTYPLSLNGALYLDNKYGDILINGWDEDRIEIQVNIDVKGKNIDKAKALLERIDANFLVTNSQIIVKTKIAEKNTSFLNKYIKKIEPLNSEKTNSDINYTINLPKHAEVEVYNKYGDIVISNWNGKLKANVAHGDLRIIDKIDNSKLSITYGKLNAKILNQANITAKNATLSIENAQTLRLDSSGSILHLEQIDHLNINSNKDDIEINAVHTVIGASKYSKLLLHNIVSKLDLNLNLSELRLLKFKTSTPKLYVQQKLSDVYVNISKTNFKFNAELEQGVLRLPKTMQNISSTLLDEKRKIRQINATYGTTTNGVFDLKGYKGIIIFKEL
jgi:hypothetical protein